MTPWRRQSGTAARAGTHARAPAVVSSRAGREPSPIEASSAAKSSVRRAAARRGRAAAPQVAQHLGAFPGKTAENARYSVRTGGETPASTETSFFPTRGAEQRNTISTTTQCDFGRSFLNFLKLLFQYGLTRLRRPGCGISGRVVNNIFYLFK